MPFNFLHCEYGPFVIQQRYMLAFMTFMAIVNCYNCRMCLHVAITEIAKPIHSSNSSSSQEDTCSGTLVARNMTGGSYDWTENQQAVILMSFYPGYLLLHVPSGLIADLYGGKHVLGMAVLISGIVTLLQPVIIQKSHWICLVLSRFALGLAQAGMYPAITSLLARWIPSRQRSVLGSFVYSGIQIGIVTGTLFTGVIIHSWKNWTLAFYIWGILCLVWYAIFQTWCYSEPDTHPNVTAEERDMLDNEFGHRIRFKTPWLAMFKDAAVWAVIIAQWGHDWITYAVEMLIPKYFKSVHKMEIDKNGIYTSIPFLGMWVLSFLTGYLSNYIINIHKYQVVTVRIWYTTIASVGPSLFIVIAMYMHCNLKLILSFYWFGMVLMAPYYAGLKVNVLDLSLNFSGVLIALANGIGVTAGLLSPPILVLVAPQQTITQWKYFFWITFGLCSATNIVYIIWASGEKSHWDHEPERAE